MANIQGITNSIVYKVSRDDITVSREVNDDPSSWWNTCSIKCHWHNGENRVGCLKKNMIKIWLLLFFVFIIATEYRLVQLGTLIINDVNNYRCSISVCIPMYNASAYLRECIESILCQTFSDFELLIVDDGSTDESRDIVRSYQDPRIRLISHEYLLNILL